MYGHRGMGADVTRTAGWDAANQILTKNLSLVGPNGGTLQRSVVATAPLMGAISTGGIQRDVQWSRNADGTYTRVVAITGPRGGTYQRTATFGRGMAGLGDCVVGGIDPASGDTIAACAPSSTDEGLRLLGGQIADLRYASLPDFPSASQAGPLGIPMGGWVIAAVIGGLVLFGGHRR